MAKLHAEGIRTTCYIAPIFPEITNVEKIIDRVKNICNLVWLENLNSRFSACHFKFFSLKFFQVIPYLNFRERFLQVGRNFFAFLR